MQLSETIKKDFMLIVNLTECLNQGIVNLKICSERKMPFGKEKSQRSKNHHGRCLADAYFTVGAVILGALSQFITG